MRPLQKLFRIQSADVKEREVQLTDRNEQDSESESENEIDGSLADYPDADFDSSSDVDWDEWSLESGSGDDSDNDSYYTDDMELDDSEDLDSDQEEIYCEGKDGAKSSQPATPSGDQVSSEDGTAEPSDECAEASKTCKGEIHMNSKEVQTVDPDSAINNEAELRKQKKKKLSKKKKKMLMKKKKKLMMAKKQGKKLVKKRRKKEIDDKDQSDTLTCEEKEKSTGKPKKIHSEGTYKVNPQDDEEEADQNDISKGEKKKKSSIKPKKSQSEGAAKLDLLDNETGERPKKRVSDLSNATWYDPFSGATAPPRRASDSIKDAVQAKSISNGIEESASEKVTIDKAASTDAKASSPDGDELSCGKLFDPKSKAKSKKKKSKDVTPGEADDTNEKTNVCDKQSKSQKRSSETELVVNAPKTDNTCAYDKSSSLSPKQRKSKVKKPPKSLEKSSDSLALESVDMKSASSLPNDSASNSPKPEKVKQSKERKKTLKLVIENSPDALEVNKPTANGTDDSCGKSEVSDEKSRKSKTKKKSLKAEVDSSVEWETNAHQRVSSLTVSDNTKKTLPMLLKSESTRKVKLKEADQGETQLAGVVDSDDSCSKTTKSEKSKKKRTTGKKSSKKSTGTLEKMLENIKTQGEEEQDSHVTDNADDSCAKSSVTDASKSSKSKKKSSKVKLEKSLKSGKSDEMSAIKENEKDKQAVEPEKSVIGDSCDGVPEARQQPITGETTSMEPAKAFEAENPSNVLPVVGTSNADADSTNDELPLDPKESTSHSADAESKPVVSGKAVADAEEGSSPPAQASESEAVSHETKYAPLERELAASKKVVAQLTKEAASKRSEARDLQLQLLTSLDNVKRLTEDLSEHKNQSRIKSNELVTAKAQLNASSSEIESLKSKLENLEKDLKRDEEKIADLEVTAQNEKRERDILLEKLETANLEIIALEEEKLQVQRQNDSLLSSTSNLEQKLESIHEELRKTEMKLDEKELLIQSLQENKKQEDATDVARNDIGSNEIHRLEAQKLTLEKEAQCLRARNDQLQIELDDTRNELEFLRGKVIHKDDDINSLRVTEAELRFDLDTIRQQKESVEEDLKNVQSESAHLLVMKTDIIATLETELDKTKKRLEPLESAEKQLHAADIEKVRLELEETKRALEDSKATGMSLQAQYEALDSAYKALQGAMKNQVAMVDEEAQKADDLKAKITHLTKKAYEYKSRYEEAEKKLEEYGKSEDGSSPDDSQQANFLQAAMDKKKSVNGPTAGQRWGQRVGRILQTGSRPEDQGSFDQNRVRELEEQKANLEAMVEKLRSDMVKQQTIHKEESYLNQRVIEELRGKNNEFVSNNENISNVYYDGPVARVKAL